MKAIGFDLGKTLIDYKDIPLSWQPLYRKALSDVAMICGCSITDNFLNKGELVLLKYNTRINPRIIEVTSETIIREILTCWGVPAENYLKMAETAFFSHFRKKLVVFNDTIRILKSLKDKNIKIGILTDVPYGMSNEFLNMDLAPIAEYIDVVLSSVDVGFRKPYEKGFVDLAIKLDIDLADMVFVGDEEKDIIGANSVGMFSVLIDRTGKSISCGENKQIASLLEIENMI